MASDGDDIVAGPDSKWEVPAAFYRDTPSRTPSRDDPHWVEFKVERDPDSLPQWMLLAAPILMLVVMALHGVLALVLLWIMHPR